MALADTENDNIDVGDADLNNEELNLPDHRLTELGKKMSSMSDSRFNGEVSTPSKIEENQQILSEELVIKNEEIERL
jgi:hypothetical protein